MNRKYKKSSPGVYYFLSKMALIAEQDIEFLKKEAKRSPLGRARLCAHKSPSDSVHEMIIALDKNTYIRPHSHRNKSESYHVIQGKFDVVFFRGKGHISNVIPMGPKGSGLNFFLRVEEGMVHTLVLRSKSVVFHETTEGPYDPHQSSLYASWAPENNQKVDIDLFRRKLSNALKNIREK
ncbi:MAG: hypothetical protein KCHDKBKB_00445 [Elusimicrobia bacterium]|nr:hypothetical protein [Elusimicrobiota bacterium]